METIEAAMQLSASDPSRLQETARQVRLDIIEMLYRTSSKGTALRPSMPFLDKCRLSTPVASANNLTYSLWRYEPKWPGSKSGFHTLALFGR